MERYKEIDTDQRGIYHGDGRSIAWFTDPPATFSPSCS